jgi:hypothetical protein
MPKTVSFMQKRLLSICSFLFIFFFIPVVSTQIIQNRSLTNIGSNFETSCNGSICTTAIYSYDKYFDRNGTWELIDESWHSCIEGFCTNNYYFNATVDRGGLVKINSGNGRFNQRISNFGTTNVSLSTPEVSGSLLTYRDILPNVDLVYQYLPHKLKEEMIIKRPIQNLQGQDFEIIFPISGDLNPVLDDPFICDSSRKCSNLSYSVSSEQISLSIPIEFLNSRDTVYPLVIDPSINIGNSSIIWNGMIQYYFDGDLLGYTRTSNPASLKLGVVPFGNYRSDIDWSLESIPDYGVISNVTFSVFFESVTTNVINITNMEKNSSQYTNSLSGNGNFYSDILNGTVYSNYSVSSNTTNLFVNFTFNQQGINDLNLAFNGTKRFNFGIHSDNSNDTISARDNSNSSRRPYMLITYDISNSSAYEAIEEGITNILPGNLILSNQQIYLVSQNGQHSLGRFDKATTKNNQTWAFNYISSGESEINMSSLFNILNIWKNSSLNTSEITSQVEVFINNTLI